MAKIISQTVWEDGPRTVIRIKLEHKGRSQPAVEKIEISGTNLHSDRSQILLVLGPDGYVSMDAFKEGYRTVRK